MPHPVSMQPQSRCVAVLLFKSISRCV